MMLSLIKNRQFFRPIIIFWIKLDLSFGENTSRTQIAKALLTSFFLLWSTYGFAAPWIDPGDERTRHHLEFLVDSGAFNLPLTTWPLTWVSVKAELDRLDSKDLSELQRWSYHYLQHEFEKASRKTLSKLRLHGSNYGDVFRSFASDTREKAEATYTGEYVGTYWSYRLQTTHAHDPIDEEQTRLDGSFVAGLWGNWAFGAGAIDRWWGPGWQSSMILSNNARPTPGLFIQRNNPKAFQSSYLKWIGPWQLTTFMNQLDEEKHIPQALLDQIGGDQHVNNALLWGMRISFRPAENIEIGLSRTAQWAGDGRPRSLDVLFDLLTGNDNRADAESEEQRNSEPGNQLGGIDFRWGLQLQDYNGSIYGQFIGEDEAGGLPSRGIAMAGLEISGNILGTHSRFALEGSNSEMSFYSDHNGIDGAYDHHIYRGGYRFNGRALGSSLDSDSESAVLKADHYFENGHQLSWQFSSYRINHDQGGTSTFGLGNSIQHTHIEYTFPANEHVQLQLGGHIYSDEFVFNGQNINTSVYLIVNTIF